MEMHFLMDLYEGFMAKNVWGPKMTLRKAKFIENSLKLASNDQTNKLGCLIQFKYIKILSDSFSLLWPHCLRIRLLFS